MTQATRDELRALAEVLKALKPLGPTEGTLHYKVVSRIEAILDREAQRR